MADGLTELERRLQRLEQLIYRVAEKCGCLEEERAEIGPPDGFTRLLRRDWNRLDERLTKNEIKLVRVDMRVGRYMSQRTARDNMLRRSADAMTDGIEAFEERLNNVELAAFPFAAEAVARAIGDVSLTVDPKSEALDRRAPRSKPKA